METDWIHFNAEEISVIKIAIAKKRRANEKELANAKSVNYVKGSMAKLAIIQNIEKKLNEAFISSGNVGLPIYKVTQQSEGDK